MWERWEGGPKSRIRILIIGNLFLILFCSLLLRGAVSEIYWYPLALLIVLTFGLSLWSWEQGWINPPRISGLEFYLFAWLLAIILSGLLSTHRWMSILALERILVSILFFYLILWHFNDRILEKVLLWFLFSLPVLFSLVGIGFWVTHKTGQRIILISRECLSGPFVNHNNFAGLILLGFFLGGGFILSLRRKHKEPLSENLAKRALLSFPLLILLLALVLSLSRSGWIAFALASICFLSWMALGSRGQKFKPYLILILGIILLAIISSLFLARDALRARAQILNEFLTDPASGLELTGRKMLWQSTLNMIRDHPWFGIGPGAFWAEYPSYRLPGELHGESHSHNDLLQLAAETGIPSAIIFLLLLVKAFRLWLKKYQQEMDSFERRVSAGIVFGMFAFLLQDQVDFHFHIPGLVYYFLALTAFILKPTEQEQIK